MKRSVTVFLSFLLGLFLLSPPAAVAAGADPYCGIRWGSLMKQADGTGGSVGGLTTLANVRSGRHDCYDRLVIDVNGSQPGYRVEYVDEIRTDGAGFLVPTRGGARLQILTVAAYDQDYNPTYDPANEAELTNVTGYQTFRQVVWAGSYEGQSTVGLGVRARLPFRVFTLAGPGDMSRLVVDVAHYWVAPTGTTTPAADPYCGITWGSLQKQATAGYFTGQLTNVRTGRHDCYDRLVLDVNGPVTEGGTYWVRYVDEVRTDGAGIVVPLRGGATLSVSAMVPAYDDDGNSTYEPANGAELSNVTGYDTFRQVAFAGSFEANTTIGLGVRARLPFRVFVLDGPGGGSRLVVDVAHRW